jgi:DNA-binding NarL/FixJ family response regulator
MGDEAFEAEYAAGRLLDPSRLPAVRGGRAGTAPVRAAATAPAPRVGDDPDVTVLTAREIDVLSLVSQGLSNRDIAERLVLSEHTVHRHLANILGKLGLSSRAAAAAWGARAGLE